VTGAERESSLAAFRAEVRHFLRTHLPPDIRRKTELGLFLDREDLLRWHRILYARGWVAPAWPRRHGGAEWSPEQRHIFEEEAAEAGAPQLIPMALTIVGPLVIAFGSEEQQRRWLPRILDGSEVWCQGFSEPGAGSDLAALRCRAVRDGDRYLVDGTKIWTTQAHWADRCLLLARTATGPRRQQGITILAVDMCAPGVSVRPIPTLDGAHVLNEVRFEGVSVPVEDRIGAEGEGWPALKAIIGNERLLNADVGRTKALLRRLRAIASVEPGGLEGQPLMRDPHFRRRLARLEIALHAVEATALRFMRDPTLAAKPETALLKIRGTELQQDVARLLSETVALYGLPQNRDFLHGVPGAEPIGPEYAAALTPFHLFWRKASISAGTNEVMRDLVAAALLD